jgi:hypothetical protein
MILETSISNYVPVIDHHILPHLGGHEAIKRITPQTVRIINYYHHFSDEERS